MTQELTHRTFGDRIRGQVTVLSIPLQSALALKICNIYYQA